MDKLCQYSTIIFASNVPVLLIVSVVTDYWEYRGFRVNDITTNVRPSNTTSLYKPRDTDSYLIVRYFWDKNVNTKILPGLPADITLYQSPALVCKYTRAENVTTNVTYFNGRVNLTVETTYTRIRRMQDVIVLYVQYSNLFRECDSLESGVRSRLGLTQLRSHRCYNFIASGRAYDDYIFRELPATIHLERIAFTFAVICIISSFVSVIGGAYGSVAKDKRSVLVASMAALVSGVALTVAIALFHGKCHLIRRREFMEGEEIPYKKTINDSQIHYYGWSFFLAWICVALCFLHSWVWLKKSQDMEDRFITKRNRIYQNWAQHRDGSAILDL